MFVGLGSSFTLTGSTPFLLSFFMNEYNVIIATTTSFDTLGVEQGYTVKVTTYPLEIFVIAIQIGIIFFTIKAFIRKKAV